MLYGLSLSVCMLRGHDSWARVTESSLALIQRPNRNASVTRVLQYLHISFISGDKFADGRKMLVVNGCECRHEKIWGVDISPQVKTKTWTACNHGVMQVLLHFEIIYYLCSTSIFSRTYMICGTPAQIKSRLLHTRAISCQHLLFSNITCFHKTRGLNRSFNPLSDCPALTAIICSLQRT